MPKVSNTDPDALEIGRRIAAKRQALAFSPEKFAGLVGIDAAQLAAIENGEDAPGALQLSVIANALGLKLIDLLN